MRKRLLAKELRRSCEEITKDLRKSFERVPSELRIFHHVPTGHLCDLMGAAASFTQTNSERSLRARINGVELLPCGYLARRVETLELFRLDAYLLICRGPTNPSASACIPLDEQDEGAGQVGTCLEAHDRGDVTLDKWRRLSRDGGRLTVVHAARRS